MAILHIIYGISFKPEYKYIKENVIRFDTITGKPKEVELSYSKYVYPENISKYVTEKEHNSVFSNKTYEYKIKDFPKPDLENKDVTQYSFVGEYGMIYIGLNIFNHEEYSTYNEKLKVLDSNTVKEYEIFLQSVLGSDIQLSYIITNLQNSNESY